MSQSLLGWAIMALGPLYLILLPLSALIGFVGVLVLLFRGRGPMAAVSVLLFVHAPLMIGIFAAIQGLIGAFQVIAGGGATPKPSDLGVAFSTTLFAPVVAMLLMVPSYLAATIGTFVRAVSSRRHETSTTP